MGGIKYFVYFFYLPIILIIRVIAKFYLLRFGEIESSRIGHFACCTEMYLCEKDYKINIPKIKYLDLFILGRKVCNKQISIHIKRKLIILPRIILGPLISLNSIIPGGKKHNCFLRKDLKQTKTFFDHRDTNNLLDISKKHFEFKNKEVFQARKTCEKIGINLYKKIVVINLRDNHYFNKHHANKNLDRDYVKNCNIDDYKEAIQDLTNSDYQVIRIGKGSTKQLSIYIDNFFDLTNHHLRTDLLELYLTEKSSFMIGCNSGGTYAPLFLFRKPTYISNFLPLGVAYMNSNKILINFKSIISKKTNRILSMSDIYNERLFSYEFTKEYREKNLMFKDIDPIIIRQSVNEIKLRTENKWIISDHEKALESKFIKKYSEILKKDDKDFYHGKIKCHFGFDYLKANEKFII